MAVREQLITDHYAIYNGDSCEVLPTLPAESIGLSVYSPPFGGMLYQYSSDAADLSNTKDYDEFFEHYGFIVRELHRLTMPGRMTAVHCMDIMRGGAPASQIDFPGHLIRAHEENGWKYAMRFHIWKEPLTVRNRTMVRSLHHATLVEDSTLLSNAGADYLLVFRRSGENKVPVTHERGLLRYAGAGRGENLSEPADGIPPEAMKYRGHKGNQINNAYSQWIWRQYASSNWYDIRVDRTLGKGASLYSNNRAEKEESDEKHMHPLQLDVIERCIELWSNPGETVLTPFLGIGSEVYAAVSNGRRGIGVELKNAYYQQAVKHLASVEMPKDEDERSLFDDEQLAATEATA